MSGIRALSAEFVEDEEDNPLVMGEDIEESEDEEFQPVNIRITEESRREIIEVKDAGSDTLDEAKKEAEGGAEEDDEDLVPTNGLITCSIS